MNSAVFSSWSAADTADGGYVLVWHLTYDASDLMRRRASSSMRSSNRIRFQPSSGRTSLAHKSASVASPRWKRDDTMSNSCGIDENSARQESAKVGILTM